MNVLLKKRAKIRHFLGIVWRINSFIVTVVLSFFLYLEWGRKYKRGRDQNVRFLDLRYVLLGVCMYSSCL